MYENTFIRPSLDPGAVRDRIIFYVCFYVEDITKRTSESVTLQKMLSVIDY